MAAVVAATPHIAAAWTSVDCGRNPGRKNLKRPPDPEAIPAPPIFTTKYYAPELYPPAAFNSKSKMANPGIAISKEETRKRNILFR